MNPRALEPVRCPLAPEPVRALVPAVRQALAGERSLLPLPPDDPAAADRLLAAARPQDGIDPQVAVVIGTSGSTGRSKGTALTPAALSASARATHEYLGGAGHWLLALPVHHIAGWQVIVRTLVAGTHLSTVDASAGFTAAAFRAAAAAMPSGRRYTAMVPTQLARVLDDPAATAAAASFDAIIVGGAAAPARLLAAATAAGIRTSTTYGMSETSGGCVYDGTPLPGVRIDIAGGTIRLTGPMLASGYLHEPELTAAAFVDGWFLTRDLGRWSAGRLDVLGRADDLVISGGEKIAPALVERALLSVPGIRAACVVGLPDPEWGHVVAAVVAGPAGIEPAAASAVERTVGRRAVPKRMLVRDALPMLASGKVDRAGITRLLEAQLSS
ncbi:MAG TPA: o-succinylbenzoate--CoA ligase [Mycobacteriales bacterium]|nr:o-succinylbenzoate--CoA ligase [Mycobacteriales bacterium]